MEELLSEIKKCTICIDKLELGANPVLAAHPKSRIAIIGQAPGSIVHKSGIPWDDKSGERLRDWLAIDNSLFYNPEKIALIPMGFCYPGKGKTGDLPPTPECAPQWHNMLFNEMNDLKLVILIGTYAQSYYLKERRKKTLTETVKNYAEYLPDFFVLPHPSPRNNIWIKKNQWFEKELVPELKRQVNKVLE
ncbi:MAG: uracil-DNA glycosylase family protein [Ekhidna sp.]